MGLRQRVNDALFYNAESGNFWWKFAQSSLHRIDRPAGTICQGYIRIYLGNKAYFAHKLAFLLMTGEIPHRVDHRDCVRSNNKWENLRAATQVQNCMNRKLRCDSRSGVKGVSAYHRKWKACIQVNGHQIYLGLFSTIEEAGAAYAAAANKWFGEFARS